jgi:hypothetical protein
MRNININKLNRKQKRFINHYGIVAFYKKYDIKMLPPRHFKMQPKIPKNVLINSCSELHLLNKHIYQNIIKRGENKAKFI